MCPTEHTAQLRRNQIGRHAVPLRFLRALCSFAVKNCKPASTAKTRRARSFREELSGKQEFTNVSY